MNQRNQARENLKSFREAVKREYPEGRPKRRENGFLEYHSFCVKTALEICGDLDRDLLEKITGIPRSTIFDTIKKNPEWDLQIIPISKRSKGRRLKLYHLDGKEHG
jgi:hypothetical protein